MKKTMFFAIVIASLGYTLPGHSADKVDAVKAAVAAACGGKTVSNSDAPRIVKQLFVSCESGQDVDVDGCKVKCLK